jgi:hypothetical protein
VGAVAVLVLLGAGVPAAAKLDAEQWKAAMEEYTRVFSAPGSELDKTQIEKTLVSDEDARSWKLLVDALVKESEFWLRAQTELNEKTVVVNELLAKGLKGYSTEDEKLLQKLQAELPGLESAVRIEKGILQAIIDALAAGPEALRKNILARGKAAPEWNVRVAAARVAAKNPSDPDAKSYLQQALERDKDARVRLAALETLATAQADWEHHVLGRLADSDWGVQMLAIRIVSERRLRRAVPHLINALEKSSPRVQQEIGTLLKALTGQNIEAYGDVWAKWWAEHKEEFEAGGEAGAAASPTVKAGPKKEEFPDVKFYGLKVKTDKVMFIIDISGSMKLETKNPGPAPGTPKPPAGPITPTDEAGGAPAPPPPEEIMSGPKIDVSKDELRKAIKKLPKNAKFNIIAFNTGAQPWQPGMKDATEANKEEALKWVRTLSPSGSTYIDGALRMAFQMAGTGAVDKAYQEVAIDTIVLMSDGAPTDNSVGVDGAAKIMDPEVILQHVREWNVQKRVVIHAIAVDLVDGVEFMVKLAAENGGTFLDR